MQPAKVSVGHRYRIGAPGLVAAVAATCLTLLGAVPASAATLDQIRDSGKIIFGYHPDARPFSFDDGSGTPIGFSVTLCEKVAEEVKTELGLGELVLEWVPITLENRLASLEQGKVNLVCSADTVTLQKREGVSFSIPIYPAGIAAMLRSDAPKALQDVLLGRPPSGPIWRASPAQILEAKTFSVTSGTLAESWLMDRLNDFQLSAKVVPVKNYEDGTLQVLEGAADVFFGERPILVEAAAKSESGSDLILLERLFTSEPMALTVPKNDDDFRLVVDRSLSRQFSSKEFRDLYSKWFGAPDEAALTFFRQSALPE